MQKHMREAVNALKGIGCRAVHVETGRGHHRIRFTYKDHQAFIIAASSPRTEHSASWAVQDARRVLGLASAGPGEHRKRYKKSNRDTKVTVGQITIRPDPMEELANHAQFHEVQKLRVREYFRQMWAETCCQLYNAPSVLASVRRDYAS